MSEPDELGPGRLRLPSSIEALLDADVDGLLDAPEKPKKVTSTRPAWSVRSWRSWSSGAPMAGSRTRQTREIAERKLGARLDGILANEDKIAALKHLDEFGLLEAPEAPASIDDLLEGDDLDLLGDESGLLDVSDLPVRRQQFDTGVGSAEAKCRGLRPVRAAVQAEARRAARRHEPAPARSQA